MSERTAYERAEEIGGHLFIKLKTGRRITFWDAIRDAEGAHTAMGRGMSRAFKLAKDDWDWERIELRLDRIEDHTRALRKHLDEVRAKRSKHERIALLRNNAGRTPEEAELYNRKADELEAAL